MCGAGLLLQAWRSRRRWLALFLIGLVVAGGLCALIAFHFAFSDDWLGPLRPGSGAWKENALDFSIWNISLPGHWLHVTDGILNNSPLYFFALVGLLALARLRDRRVWSSLQSIYAVHRRHQWAPLQLELRPRLSLPVHGYCPARSGLRAGLELAVDAAPGDDQSSRSIGPGDQRGERTPHAHTTRERL